MISALLAACLLLAVPSHARAVVGRPIDVPTPSPAVQITGSGWGHGVGMSQYGAQAQALAGWGVNRILRYWYRGVEITRTPDSDKAIVVGMATAATRPDVVVEEGVGQWLGCTTKCERLLGPAGQRLTQTPEAGPWTVVATTGGRLALRRGTEVLWEGPSTIRLRLRLSTDDRQRDVARVLRTRHRWGSLEFSTSAAAECSAPQLCVTARVPSVERYLRGIAEMPSSWAAAALRAQATVGRTYALRMRAGGLRPSCRCHLLASPAHQAYAALDKEEGFSGDRWVASVAATAGRVVRHNGALAGTFYSSSHGGRSERISDSYAYSAPASAYPYLRSVADPWSSDPRAGNPYARWTRAVGNAAFARYVDRRLVRVTGVTIRSRTAGGTPEELVVSGHDRAGDALTTTFSGVDGKQVGDHRVWIAGAELKQRFSLRSQQISRIGLAPFSDDDGNAHEYTIATLAAAGVVTGCAPDRYCPGAPVSRAQTAALLARALQLPSPGSDLFVDDDGSVHERDINAAATAGLTTGCRPQRFCPGRRLRRGQMASLLARALRLPAATSDAFSDDDATTHEDNINRLAAAGITSGRPDGGFRPNGSVTRAQLTSFLVRALRWAAGR